MTAVEWLENELADKLKLIVLNNDFRMMEGLFEKAKAMEKEQMIDAFWNGDNTNCIAEQNAKEFAEKYYTETYKLK